MDRYDIIIVGSGPAGVSAAITATVRGKRILLLGEKDISKKLRKASLIRNYPGLTDVSGNVLADAYAQQLTTLGIEIDTRRALMVYSMGSYFSVQTSTNEILEASSVILAMGVNAGKQLPGEEQFLGRGVSYCATCDAPLCKGKRVIVVGYDEEAEAEADFLSEVASEVLFIPMRKEEPRLKAGILVAREKPIGIEGMFKATGLRTDAGLHEADHIFVLRESVAVQQLVPGLKTDGPHVCTDIDMATNLPGCFVCGDIAGKPYQLAKAAGQGNIAALSAVKHLDTLKQS